MKGHSLLIFFLLCLIVPAARTQVLPDSHYLYGEIGKLILYETEIEKLGTPGILVGIVDGEQSYMLSIGQKDMATEEKLQPDDLFEIGSLTKPLTASLLSRFVSDERISWDTRITGLVPDSCRNPGLSGVTLGDLASHQSGFPKYPPYIGKYEEPGKNLFARYPESEICSYLQKIDAAPDGAQYSHLNYGIIEIMMEHAFSRKIDVLLDSLLFRPLGMKSTGFNNTASITPGYDLGGSLATPMEFASCSASEGVRSTLNDLIRFLRWNLGVLEIPGLTSKAVLEDLQDPAFPSNLGKEIFFTRGWFLVHPKKKRDVFIHSGRSRGHHASISFCTQTGTGVVVLSNSAFGTDNLGYLILRMINRNWKRKTNG